GRVHVVSAGVTGTLIRRPVRYVLLVVDRQRVDVSPQRHYRAGGRAGADVDSEPGALGQDVRPQAGRFQPQRYPASGPVLVVTGLRMGMQVTTEINELALVHGQKRVELALKVMLGHALPPRGHRNTDRHLYAMLIICSV